MEVAMAVSDTDEIARRIKRAGENTWRNSNIEKKRAYERAYYAKTIEKRREKAKTRYANETPEQRAKRNEYQKEYVKNNPENILANKRRYREKNREKLRAAHHAYIRDDNGKPNAKYLHRKKRTIERRAADLETLAGRPKPLLCEVCGGPPSDRAGMNFDHCHTTGRFRGWLCRNCNVTLGLVGDNSQRLRALADYLDRFNDQVYNPPVE
jgi:hypothetical protein